MSYNYRTGEEQMLAILSKEKSVVISSSQAGKFNKIEEKIGKFFNYHLDERGKEFLDKHGVYLSPFAFRAHSHPVCKSIENHILYEMLPLFISGLSSFTVCSMKKSKFDNLKTLVNDCSLELINCARDTKDLIRYGQNALSPILFDNMLKKEKFNGNFFFHDEVHYWDIRKMSTFVDAVRPNLLMFSIVYPIEVLFGATQSYNPDCYEFTIDGDKLIFFPDGVRSEGYVQPINLDWLFQCSSIKLKDGSSYGLQLIKSVGAHHLFALSPVSFIVDKSRHFGGFDILDVGPLSGLNYIRPIEGVRYSVFTKVVSYLCCLKSPDVVSCSAKLRHLSGSNINLFEQVFFRDFADKFIKNGIGNVTDDSVFGPFLKACREMLPTKLQSRFKVHKKDVILKAMMECKKVEYKIKLSELDLSNGSVEDFIDVIKGKMVNFLAHVEPASKKLLTLGLKDEVFLNEVAADSYFRWDGVSNKLYVPIRHDVIKKAGLVYNDCSFAMINDCDMMFIYPDSFDQRKFSANRVLRYVLSFPDILSVVHSVHDGKCTFHNTGDDIIDRISCRQHESCFERPCFYSAQSYEYIIFRKVIICWLTPYRRVVLNLNLSILGASQDFSEPEETKSDAGGVHELINGEGDSQINLSLAQPHKVTPSYPLTRFFHDEETFLSNRGVNVGASCSSSVSDGSFSCVSTTEVPSLMTVDKQVVNDDLEVFVRSLDWSKADKLKSRSAFFLSSDSLGYGHDRVRYRTFKMPSALRRFAEMNSLNVNTALVQKFDAGAYIPFHADDEACYNIDDPVYAVNLGSATFLSKNNMSKKVEKLSLANCKTYSMESGFQRFYKHSVSNCEGGRISITFRNQRSSCFSVIKMLDLPRVCEEMEPLNHCFPKAVIEAAGVSCLSLVTRLKGNQKLLQLLVNDSGFSMEEVSNFCEAVHLRFKVHTDSGCLFVGPRSSTHQTMALLLKDNHFVATKEIGFNPLVKVDEVVSVRALDGVSVVSYKSNGSAAKALVDSFLSGATGVASDAFCGRGLDKFGWFSQVDIARDVLTLYGFAGAGKSKPVQDFLRNNNVRALVISPRKFLLNDWISKVGVSNKLTLKTFECVYELSLRLFDLVIMDECSLFPEGYLDLLAVKLIMDKSKAELLLIGDPLQAKYFSSLDRSNLVLEAQNCPLNRNSLYLGYSFRCGKWINSAIKGISMEDGVCDPYDLVDDFSDLPILVPSFKDKEAINCYYRERGYESPVMTYGESQGLTFDKTIILINPNSRLVDEGRMMVAITRSRKRPSVLFQGTCFSDCEHLCKGRVIRAFLFKQTISINELINCNVVGRPIKNGGLRHRVAKAVATSMVGHNVEERCAGDPHLKHMLILHDEPECEEPEMEEFEVVEPCIKTHINHASHKLAFIECSRSESAASCNTFDDVVCSKSSNWLRIADFDREASIAGLATEQFSKMKQLRVIEENCADSYESVFPVHSSEDTATFLWACKKRLRFSNPVKEMHEIEDANLKASVLFSRFKECFLKEDIRHKLDNVLFDECLVEFSKKKVEKSVALLTNHALRSEPDWPRDVVSIFMKSQHCTKLDNILINAKAGQTLACFQHEVLVHFGPWCRYLDKFLCKNLRNGVYLHNKKNFNELNEFVKEHRKSIKETCVESDYSAFDRSQDAVMLVVELMFMEMAGVPYHIMEDYKHMKTTLGSKMGNFAIMRFTGEFSTFLFNTIANMAFTAVKYENVKQATLLFSGDDMCSFGDLVESEDIGSFLDGMALQAKVFRSKFPVFCGWVLTPYGILKHPELIMMRLCAAKEMGKIDRCIDSYTIELSYAYKLGDKIYDVLDERLLEAHHACVKFVMQRRHKISSSIIRLMGWVDQKLNLDRKKYYLSLKRGKPATISKLLGKSSY